MTFRRPKTLVLLLGLLAISSLPASAKQASSEEPAAAAQTQSAESSAEHRAAAKRFQDEAVQFEKQAAEHERMATEYRQRAHALPKYNYATLAEHCDRLAKDLKAAASEARETAKLHEAVAQLGNK